MVMDGGALDAVGVGDHIERRFGGLGRCSKLQIFKIIRTIVDTAKGTLVQEGACGVVSNGRVFSRGLIRLDVLPDAVDPQSDDNDDNKDEDTEASKDSLEPVGDGNR